MWTFFSLSFDSVPNICRQEYHKYFHLGFVRARKYKWPTWKVSEHDICENEPFPLFEDMLWGSSIRIFFSQKICFHHLFKIFAKKVWKRILSRRVQTCLRELRTKIWLFLLNWGLLKRLKKDFQKIQILQNILLFVTFFNLESASTSSTFFWVDMRMLIIRLYFSCVLWGCACTLFANDEHTCAKCMPVLSVLYVHKLYRICSAKKSANLYDHMI